VSCNISRIPLSLASVIARPILATTTAHEQALCCPSLPCTTQYYQKTLPSPCRHLMPDPSLPTNRLARSTKALHLFDKAAHLPTLDNALPPHTSRLTSVSDNFNSSPKCSSTSPVRTVVSSTLISTPSTCTYMERSSVCGGSFDAFGAAGKATA
jgi:hypothetical protein